MSSKSSRQQEGESSHGSESDSDVEGRKRHHHRHRHGHRDRHRSQSRSRSPKHRIIKPERQSRDNDKHSHSRDGDHKPLKHRDHEDNRRRDRHHEQRHHQEETQESHKRREKKHKRRDDDRDAERSHKARNGSRNHMVAEEEHQIGTLRGKWDNDPGAESDSPRDRARGPGSRENSRGPGHQVGQVRIKQEREWNDQRRTQDSKRKPPNPFETESGEAGPSEETGPPPEKEKPNFGTSGKLTEDTNTYRGIVIKYNEPPEARKPKRKWRFYVFKGDQELPVVHIHRQSAYLMGRERLIADLPIDHPSCSKQHAVLQYRLVPYERADGNTGKRVRPYIIDLESSNGTYINNNRIDSKRYYELHEKDVLKFGYSTREYVLLHDKSKDDNPDEDLGAD